nr:transposase [Pseudodesulfovibrio sediminis]
MSLPEVAEWDDETVRAKFQQLRWPKTEGEPYCPTCGSVDHYFIKARKQWRCKDCGHTYSVTSDNWLHSTKVGFEKRQIDNPLFCGFVLLCRIELFG